MRVSDALITVVLGTAFVPTAQALDDSAKQWARAYYREGRICSMASVSALAIGTDRIVVSLSIDPRWANSLLENTEVRERWFALHCPMPMMPIWPVLGPDEDIVIKARLPDAGLYSISCREFLARQREDQQARSRKTARKTAEIRRRLGISEESPESDD